MTYPLVCLFICLFICLKLAYVTIYKFKTIEFDSLKHFNINYLGIFAKKNTHRLEFFFKKKEEILS